MTTLRLYQDNSVQSTACLSLCATWILILHAPKLQKKCSAFFTTLYRLQQQFTALTK